MMKAIFQILLIALGTLLNVYNERVVEETWELKDKKMLELDLKFADEIRIDTWNKNEVMIKVKVSINDNLDNDKFQLITKENDNSLKIVEEIRDLKKIAKKRYVIEENEEGQQHIVNGEQVKIDLFYEITLPETVELSLETISGDILVFNYKKQSFIKTISGFIDYSISQTEDVVFDLSTITGELFSNLDLKIEGEDGKFLHVGGQELEAKLNKGGDVIQLKTISGNIYLRKE